LWSSLIKIAVGKASAYKAMNDFFQIVPWDDLEMISDLDQAHFADGKQDFTSIQYLTFITLSRCILGG